ncbi:hypothetical protein CR513_28714, partial [Mucuna pruriens]
MPNGYSSNISRYIDDQNIKIFRIKSHDYHILMQHLLLLAIHNVLPNSVTVVLILLTRCHLKILLPPPFFIVIVHLTCHLVEEMKLGGSMYYHSMYSIERGRMAIARRYTTYNINRYKFRAMGQDQGLKAQNNGVFLISNTSCVTSKADANLRLADLPYYGKMEDIIELNYYGFLKVILFRCKWADTTCPRGFRNDA